MKTNEIQKNYLFAKAAWQACHEIQVEKYNDFLVTKGLTEDDVNDDNFAVLSAEYDIFAKAEIENTALAWNNYRLAENTLIDFGLALAPAKTRETLANGAKRKLDIKNKLVDLALKLDTSTLPPELRIIAETA